MMGNEAVNISTLICVALNQVTDCGFKLKIYVKFVGVILEDEFSMLVHTGYFETCVSLNNYMKILYG